MILDAQGNIYGTAQDGAGSGCGGGGCGTVFKLTPQGAETTLHIFTGSDGAFPVVGLVADASGDLYGTALDGGPLHHCACGVVFKIAPDGSLTLVGSWTGLPAGAQGIAAR